MSNTTPLSANVEKLAERAVSKTDQAIESTRDVANAALDRAHKSINDLEQNGAALLSRAAVQVEELARRSMERARQTSSQVRDQVQRAGDVTVGYIKDEPVKSVVAAAAIGALAAGLIAWLARSRSQSRL